MRELVTRCKISLREQEWISVFIRRQCTQWVITVTKIRGFRIFATENFVFEVMNVTVLDDYYILYTSIGISHFNLLIMCLLKLLIFIN